MITDYTSLKAAIADWLNRADLATRLDDFVQNAEAGFNRRLRHWRMETLADLTVDGRYVALPEDWLETIRITVGDTERPLGPVSQAWMHEQRWRQDNTGGTPTTWAVTGGQLEVYPSPDATFSGTILYYAKLPKLYTSEINPTAPDTNWLLDYAPDAYLYGSLLQSAPFLKDDARIQTWGALYGAVMAELEKDGMANKGTGMRMRVG